MDPCHIKYIEAKGMSHSNSNKHCEMLIASTSLYNRGNFKRKRESERDRERKNPSYLWSVVDSVHFDVLGNSDVVVAYAPR